MASDTMRDGEQATTFEVALQEAFGVVLRMQGLTEIPCPHSGCNENAVVPMLHSEEGIVMARSASAADVSQNRRCPAGHEISIYHG